MATVNVTLSLASTDLFAKQTLSFTETDSLTVAGDQQVVGKIVTTASGTKDNLVTKALDGTTDRAYLYMKNLSVTSGEYVKVSLCATHGTDSASGDWFAVLGPGEFLFIPISDMQDVDVEPATGTPSVEYIVMEKAA